MIIFIDHVIGGQIRVKSIKDPFGKMLYRPFFFAPGVTYKIPGFIWRETIEEAENDFRNRIAEWGIDAIQEVGTVEELL